MFKTFLPIKVRKMTKCVDIAGSWSCSYRNGTIQKTVRISFSHVHCVRGGGGFHRRPTKSTSSCPDSSDSLRAGAGGTAAVAADGNNDGGGANASGPEDERTPASRKVWGVWASKDEMPALPPNKQFVAARKKEPEKDGDGVGKVDVKGDGDKEGVPREEMPVACGTTIMEDIDDSDEASIDAGFSSESCGKEEDASGHGNALEVRSTNRYRAREVNGLFLWIYEPNSRECDAARKTPGSILCILFVCWRVLQENVEVMLLRNTHIL